MTRKRKQKPFFEDRIRFNWGYHDAAHDVMRGLYRCTGLYGPQSPQYVSRQYDAAYYEGYVRGIRDARNGAYAQNSEPAWQEYQKEVIYAN